MLSCIGKQDVEGKPKGMLSERRQQIKYSQCLTLPHCPPGNSLFLVTVGRWGNALGVRGEAKMLSPPLASLDSFIEGEARVTYGYKGNWVHPHTEYPWWWKRLYGHAQLSWRKERHELGVWRREKSASFLDGMNFTFLFWRVKWLLNHAISFFPLFFVFFFFLQLSFFFIVP